MVRASLRRSFDFVRTLLTLEFVEKQANKTSEQNKRIKQANKTSERNKRLKQAKINEGNF